MIGVGLQDLTSACVFGLTHNITAGCTLVVRSALDQIIVPLGKRASYLMRDGS